MKPETKTNVESDVFSTPDLGPIEQVREGMKVIDSTGEELGKVELVKMGDPAAATIGADAPRDGGFLQGVAEAFGFEQEPDVPQGLRDRLMRIGFIKVDGAGITASARYIMADKVAGVSGDAVRLKVSKDQMIQED